jgi:hypothetical protein
MLIEEVTENVVELVEKLNFAEKVERSLELIDQRCLGPCKTCKPRYSRLYCDDKIQAGRNQEVHG